MCIPGLDPLTLGLALTGASAGLNYMGAERAERARDDALNVERSRQNKLRQEADQLNEQSRDRYDDFEGQQDQKSSDLTSYFTDAPQSATEAVGEANASAASILPSTSNNIVQREVERQSGLADAFTGQQADARGRLRSFGDLLGGISREQARDAGTISQIGNFQTGSSNVLPYELEDANQKGAGLRFLGDIVGGLGSVATTGGITAAAKTGSVPGWLGGGKFGGLV